MDNLNTNTDLDREQNPTDNSPNGDVGPEGNRGRRRTPFTDLSQVDADLVLARTLQEQERAYMMLRMDAGDGSDYGSWEANSYELEYDGNDFDDDSEDDYDDSDVELDNEAEDAFDVNAQTQEIENGNPNCDLDPSAYSSDEAYARALQDFEDQEMAARLLAMTGINGNTMVFGEDEDEDEDENEDEDVEEHEVNAQDVWEDIDPDQLSYEELLALGDVVGTESRGLSSDTIASLPFMKYKSEGTDEGSCDSCVVCRLEYEDGDTLTVLSCKHLYHPECINNWLKINKVCPVCSAEVCSQGRS